jgi:hypothetical protein
MLSRSEATAQAEASSRQGNVKEKVALFEGNDPSSPPHYDLQKLPQTRKNGMKAKQVRLSSIMCTAVPATE